jgi:type II secretory pathway pseudopilin PulG
MKIKSNNAFTIVELLVAMALVMILMGLSSVVFTTGVKAHRTADSTVEVVRRTEAICQQLSSDFRGLRTDAPMAMWFEIVDTDGDGTADTWYDQIQFFANGDFQTIKQYDSDGNGIPDKTVSGMMARIYYGHGWRMNTMTAPWTFEENYRWNSASQPGARLLARRAHLLTSDMNLTYSIFSGVSSPFPDMSLFTGAGFTAFGNNLVEYDQISLTDWQTLVQTTANCNHFLQVCFNNNSADAATAGRPIMDMKNAETLHLLMAEEVSSFQIQWAYKSEDQIKNTSTGEMFGVNERFVGVRWWPDYSRGDFYQAGFGAYFNMPGGVSGTMVNSWKTVGVGGHQSEVVYFSPAYFPRAIKFTFTVHDVKGLFPDGRTFTHIVYIEK